LTEYTNVTDTRTDRRTPHDAIGRAYAQHRAAKNKGSTPPLIAVYLIIDNVMTAQTFGQYVRAAAAVDATQRMQLTRQDIYTMGGMASELI